jgi:hypothetical protein
VAFGVRGLRGVRVRVLEYVEYPPGEHWRVVKVPDPPWADIEAAVRRLDRYRFPFLILWPSADEAEQELSGDVNAFEVRGGQGACWLAGTFGGYFQRRLDYPERGAAVVHPSTAAADSLPRVLPQSDRGLRRFLSHFGLGRGGWV